MASEIPDKQFFKIGEVSRILGVKAHVLRYWETEFSVLRPQKTRSRQRLYRRKDVELLLQIQRLLHEEGYTIAGANKRLRELARGDDEVKQQQAMIGVLQEVRGQVLELLELVQDEGSGKED